MTKLKKHFAEIAAIVNPPLGRLAVDGLTEQQQAYFRNLTTDNARSIVHGALGTFDPLSGWSTAFQSAWNCEETKQMHREALEGFDDAPVCYRCVQRRRATDASRKVFFAPEPCTTPDCAGETFSHPDLCENCKRARG